MIGQNQKNSGFKLENTFCKILLIKKLKYGPKRHNFNLMKKKKNGGILMSLKFELSGIQDLKKKVSFIDYQNVFCLINFILNFAFGMGEFHPPLSSNGLWCICRK